MVNKIVIFVAVIQVVLSQRLLPPLNYPPVLNELFDRCNQPSLSPAESDIICKNFASSIQNVILDKFAQNCLRKPVFGHIAGPLINDVANNVCRCPVCSAVNLTPNSYTKSYITPAAVSNIINNAKNANSYVISEPNKFANSVPVNSLINSVNSLVNNIPANNLVNNVPVNFVIPNNLNNVVRPANNVPITDLLSLLKGLNECSCKGFL